MTNPLGSDGHLRQVAHMRPAAELVRLYHEAELAAVKDQLCTAPLDDVPRLQGAAQAHMRALHALNAGA